MNRHDRRAAAARLRKRQDDYYDTYLRHLPLAEGLSAPGLFHMIYKHDDWCGIRQGTGICTCNPDVEIRKEPGRS